MKQETMLEKIRKSAEHVPTPEGLEPEHIMENAGSRPKRISHTVRYGSLAAMLAMVVLAAFQVYQSDQFRIGRKSAGTVLETGQEMVAADLRIQTAGGAEIGENQYIAKSYEDLYKQIQVLAKDESQTPEARGLFAAGKNQAADTGAAVVMTEAGGQSGTGAMDKSLDGADVLQADDQFLYVASPEQGAIRIVQTDGELPVQVSVIQSQSQEGIIQNLIGLYLYGNRLSVILDQTMILESNQPNETAAIATDGDGQYEDSNPEDTAAMNGAARWTAVETYDITDRGNPVLLGTTQQDGGYKSSRLEEGIIYLFTESLVNPRADAEEKTQYIPNINGELLTAENIYLPDVVTEAAYLVITSTNMEQPDQVMDKKAILSGGQQFYISTDYIYAGNSKYNYEAHQYDYTELLKLKYDQGTIVYQAHALIDGYLDSQFAMDEYDGNLRVISTSSQKEGGAVDSLHILDENLAVVGLIDDLSPGSQIYATRFIGNMGYYMTFQDAEAVFALDLTIPGKPAQIGKLKMGKFSEYLHPLGERKHQLLGIERVDDAKGNGQSSLKIVAYDISDPSIVEVIHEKLEPAYDYSAAWYYPQSVFTSPKGDLIGISTDQYNDQTQSSQHQYVVYSYSEKDGFKKLLEYPLDEGSSMASGIMSGDSFYIVESNRITKFSAQDFIVTGQLEY